MAGDFSESPFAWVYFAILVICNCVVTLVIISLTGAFYRRCKNRRAQVALSKEPERKQSINESITVLLPCYLPNEQHILKGTVTHIMENLEYPEPFQLILCYNTPKPLPCEADMLPALEATKWPKGRSLRVMKVDGSHSKAENLNACLPLVTTETLVIYDADHHPDPPSLMFAADMMRRKKCHCVQGSTYLRYKPTFLAKIIDAEFFVIFFCFFPAVQFLTRMGVFGGSNALWHTATLRKYMFRYDVQTEDIELSVRVLLGDVKIRFCPESRSGELPPKSFRALWRQRLRWEIGWDQVTMQHFDDIKRSSLSCRKKASLYYWLPWRWLMLTTAAINSFATPLLSIILGLNSSSLGPGNQFMMDYSLITFLVITFYNVSTACMVAKPRDIPWIIGFQLCGSLYLLWNLIIVMTSLFRILSGRVGKQGFVPTERGGHENSNAAKAAAAGTAPVEPVPESTSSTSYPAISAASDGAAEAAEVQVTIDKPIDKPLHKRTGPAAKSHRRTGSGTPLFQRDESSAEAFDAPGTAHLDAVRAASNFGFQFGARDASNEEAVEYDQPPAGFVNDHHDLTKRTDLGLED